MVSKKKVRVIFNVGLLLVSVWTIAESYALSIGSVNDPGPGFLSFFAAIFLGILTLINLGKILVTSMNELAFSSYKNIKNLFYTVLIIFFSTLLMNSLGFIIISTLFMICLLRFVGQQKWSSTFAITGATVISSYLIFKLILKIQLPVGLLGF